MKFSAIHFAWLIWVNQTEKQQNVVFFKLFCQGLYARSRSFQSNENMKMSVIKLHCRKAKIEYFKHFIAVYQFGRVDQTWNISG